MPSINENDDGDAARRTTRSHPAIIPRVITPERLLHATPIAAVTTSNVPALVIFVTVASFETTVQGETSTFKPLNLVERMEEALQIVTATGIVEVEEVRIEMEETDIVEKTCPKYSE